MDMFQILAGDACGGLGPFVSIIKGVFELIKIGVPIILIIMGAIDLGKAVLASDDKEIKATLLGYDEKVDIAAFTFEFSKYIQPVEMADSKTLRKGSLVFAMGNPYGYEYYGSATMGIISNTERFVSTDTDGDEVTDFYCEYIQHDASINSGNSGGGLFTLDGKLIGINTMKLINGTIENINLINDSAILLFIEEDISKVELQKVIEENGVVCNFERLKPLDIKKRLKARFLMCISITIQVM